MRGEEKIRSNGSLKRYILIKEPTQQPTGHTVTWSCGPSQGKPKGQIRTTWEIGAGNISWIFRVVSNILDFKKRRKPHLVYWELAGTHFSFLPVSSLGWGSGFWTRRACVVGFHVSVFSGCPVRQSRVQKKNREKFILLESRSGSRAIFWKHVDGQSIAIACFNQGETHVTLCRWRRLCLTEVSRVLEGIKENCELGQHADTSPHLMLWINTQAQSSLPVSYTTTT